LRAGRFGSGWKGGEEEEGLISRLFVWILVLFEFWFSFRLFVFTCLLLFPFGQLPAVASALFEERVEREELKYPRLGFFRLNENVDNREEEDEGRV
jgi:hypothetical protein